ncbi:hypothetical protein HLB42_21670 (plasmid) [Deinococcus sp. D7000]|nr:hypothetical protein HLB42_13945 [Deinococcus sp. D7000]QLG13551.1 hypothetical protein HLB42_21670 [Deinococcus sp. D7000]
MSGESGWILGSVLLYVGLCYLIERGHHGETRRALDDATQRLCAERIARQVAEAQVTRLRNTAALRLAAIGPDRRYTLRELEELS